MIDDWFRLIGTMEYLKEWELEYNKKNFNISRYADIKMQATALGFRLSPKRWIEEVEQAPKINMIAPNETASRISGIG